MIEGYEGMVKWLQEAGQMYAWLYVNRDDRSQELEHLGQVIEDMASIHQLQVDFNIHSIVIEGMMFEYSWSREQSKLFNTQKKRRTKNNGNY